MAKLFTPLGFSLSDSDAEAFPTHGLLPLSPPAAACRDVFAHWLRLNKPRGNQTKPARWAELSEGQRRAFSMAGLSVVKAEHFVEAASDQPLLFTRETEARLRRELGAEGLAAYGGYGAAGLQMVRALRAELRAGWRGLTLGSQSPWLEALALSRNVSSVTLAEYQAVRTNISRTLFHHPRLPNNRSQQLGGLEWVSPRRLAKEWEGRRGLDFAATFSSVEHSGLGRYGDRLDPLGDLRELRKIQCLLRRGGLVFLGLPSGRADGLVFNGHRVYGPLRWSLVCAGFRLLGFYSEADGGRQTFRHLRRRLHRPFPLFTHLTALLQKP